MRIFAIFIANMILSKMINFFNMNSNMLANHIGHKKQKTHIGFFVEEKKSLPKKERYKNTIYIKTIATIVSKFLIGYYSTFMWYEHWSQFDAKLIVVGIASSAVL